MQIRAAERVCTYSRFKELIDDKNELKKQISERDKQLETLKKQYRRC